jgi:drug/metabolite transporter (DMT)-like permease
LRRLFIKTFSFSKSRTFKYFLIILAVIFWGSSFIATKVALEELSPETIVSLRLIIASAFLFFIALFYKRDFSGLKYTTASNTGWIIGTAPIFMAILATLFFKEKIRNIQAAGIAIAMFGLLLLIGNGDITNIDLIKNKGDLLVLASAFTWGIYSMVNKKISLSYSPLMTILYLFIMMTIIIIPFNLDNESISSVIHLSSTGWVSVIFLGLFCSGIAYVIWAYSLRDMESAKVGAFLYFEPFVTVLAAWILLAENITALMLLSGIIITTGVILVNKDL